MRYVYLTLLLILVSCGTDREEMSAAEQELAEKLQAEYIDISTVKYEKRTDGRLSSSRYYLLVEIENPVYLNGVKHNERVFREKCQEFADYLLATYGFDSNDFEELQLDIIEKSGFLLFHRKETTSVTFDVNHNSE